MSHYKPYPAYKDSGMEWLGRVPEHWSVRKLKWEATARSGTDHKSEMGDFPLYGANGVIGSTDTPSLSFEAVLIGRVGSAGSITFVIEECGVSDNALIFYNSRYCTPRFDYYLLQSMNLEADISKNAQPLITASDIRDRTVCVPLDLLERKSIASSLDRETARIDALVAKKTRFIELLREKRQAMITHAVTKGLDPNVKMKDSGVEWLGEVPEHWQIKRLKHIANVQTGVAKGKDNAGKDTIEVPYLRVANVQDGYLSLDDVATIEIPREDLPRYSLQPGDVLMNEGGDFDKLGRGSVWQGEIQPCIHQNHVFAVRPTAVSSAWLNAFTGSLAAQFYFMGRAKQSTNLASISSTNIMELPVVLPPAVEVDLLLAHIDRETARLDALLRKTERSIELLKERRAALITAAVTGQIDLREAS